MFTGSTRSSPSSTSSPMPAIPVSTKGGPLKEQQHSGSVMGLSHQQSKDHRRTYMPPFLTDKGLFDVTTSVPSSPASQTRNSSTTNVQTQTSLPNFVNPTLGLPGLTPPMNPTSTPTAPGLSNSGILWYDAAINMLNRKEQEIAARIAALITTFSASPALSAPPLSTTSTMTPTPETQLNTRPPTTNLQHQHQQHQQQHLQHPQYQHQQPSPTTSSTQYQDLRKSQPLKLSPAPPMSSVLPMPSISHPMPRWDPSIPVTATPVSPIPINPSAVIQLCGSSTPLRGSSGGLRKSDSKKLERNALAKALDEKYRELQNDVTNKDHRNFVMPNFVLYNNDHRNLRASCSPAEMEKMFMFKMRPQLSVDMDTVRVMPPALSDRFKNEFFRKLVARGLVLYAIEDTSGYPAFFIPVNRLDKDEARGFSACRRNFKTTVVNCLPTDQSKDQFAIGAEWPYGSYYIQDRYAAFVPRPLVNPEEAQPSPELRQPRSKRSREDDYESEESEEVFKEEEGGEDISQPLSKKARFLPDFPFSNPEDR